MALIPDKENTIKFNFNFLNSPPTEGWHGDEGSQHTNFDPTTGETPSRLNRLDADKFNEIERVISEITKYLGDITTNMGNMTVGSKIRQLESTFMTSTTGTQLLYVLASVGCGIVPGDINDDIYSNKPIFGKFGINKSLIHQHEQGFKVTVNPGSALVGNSTNNATSLTVVNATELQIDEAPLFEVGNTPDPDPTNWSDGELHTGLTNNSIIYLNHGFIKTASIPLGSEMATVVAINEDDNTIYYTPSPGTFSVDLVTGKIEDKGAFSANPGNYRFYYKYYGWRIDSIYISKPTGTQTEAEVKVSKGTDLRNFRELTNSLISIKDDYTSTDSVPAYIVVITPQNNTSEDSSTSQLCYQNRGIINCGYARIPSASENIIDIRRFISPINKTKSFTNGKIGKENPLTNLDEVEKYLELESNANGIPLPDTYSPTRKLLVTPAKYMINDIPVISKTSVVEVPPTVSPSGYSVTNIYVNGPDGSISSITGNETAIIDELEEPNNNSESYVKIASIEVNNDKIERIIISPESKRYIQPVVGIGKIDGTTNEIIITHNLGTECVAQIIPIEQPDPGAPYNHVVIDYPSNNVIRGLFNNNGNDLRVLYTIVPSYGVKNSMEANTSTIYNYHGKFKNNTNIYSIEGSDINNIASEIASFSVKKQRMKDIITINGSPTGNYNIRTGEVKQDLIATYANKLSVSNNDYVIIPGTIYITRQVGILLNFMYPVTSKYWLELNSGINIIKLNFDTPQPLNSYIDSIVLK